MEDRLNTILNIFERALVENHHGKRSDYGLKNDYLDLKYEFLKLMLEASHEDSNKFNLDSFQKKVKMSSPLWKACYKRDEPELHTFNKNK
tara:strand:+ start:191 stop:460 length:270 start_codon:yes stop_codon:yes gene_type:complete